MEMILETNTLPEPLMQMVQTEKVAVTVSMINGAITLMPISEPKKSAHSLRGIAKDCGFTVDEFLARKREDKELELAQDERRQRMLRGDGS